MAQEFVKDWYLLDTLGEGRFGEVKLLMNKDSREMVAAKIVKVDTIEQQKAVDKELLIHKSLNHLNIIAMYGNRRDNNLEYMFLEYASGGELFDRIEPDKGIQHSLAFRYFHELIDAIDYLHSRGIVHRDIKPENILLDASNTVKISDFGLATLFRYNGKTRKLDQQCGSIHYIAPEVLAGQKHDAEPIDIWSCGVVLFAMLTGELPWDQANIDLCPTFKKYARDQAELHKLPWSKLRNDVLSLIKNILSVTPGKRYKIKNIRNNKWFKSYPSFVYKRTENIVSAKRRCNGFMSQPAVHDSDSNDCDETVPEPIVCSQPLNVANMFLSSQSQVNTQPGANYDLSQPGTNTRPGTRMYLKLVRRLTRFWIQLSFENAIQLLTETFHSLQLPFKRSKQYFTVTMQDRRRRPLIFKASVNEMLHSKVLVDFRLSAGEGLEFKRQFVAIKLHLIDYIEPYSADTFDDSRIDPFGNDCF